MPGWKTFDAHTAAALRERIEEPEVSVETISRPLFADEDSVVIAPTLQKGAALVITARKKAAPAAVEEPAHFAPLIEEIAAPETPSPAAVELAPEPLVTPEPVIEADIADTPREDSEFNFGPTTWERVDEVDTLAEYSVAQRDARSTDPEIWDLPSEAAPQTPVKEVVSETPAIPANPQWGEERYVATGFLGLDDYVEDEQEIARARRPWWKRIFAD